MSRVIIKLAVLLLLVSCVDSFRLDVDGSSGLLVVEGLISDEETTHTVKLSRSVSFSNTGIVSTYSVPEQNAVVKVSDDLGNEFEFIEDAAGTYKTVGTIKGEVGRSYRLSVITSDGEQYESEAELMPGVPEINSLTYEYSEREYESESSGNILTSYGFDIHVVVNDPPGVDNFYKWKSIATIEYSSVTELPDQATCWYDITPLESGVVVFADNYSEGKEFRELVAVAPYERITNIKVLVSQFSLSEPAYNFWQLISQQQNNTGSIFDPAPVGIKGNIKNVNSDEVVLGFFGASAVTRKYIVFNRLVAANYVYPKNGKSLLEGDCLLQEQGATNVKPEGF